ncbi:MoaD/ThiS family protein [Thermogladius sp. 4427co]|uniref:MoaD/ThiS family protein n=1 Tax=Thermogladius sp. 4427co TaxID=3450718 RepID=UPI003F7A1829
MRVKVVFTGRASEIAGVFTLDVDLPDGSTLDDLVKSLSEKLNPKLYRRFSQGHYVFVTFVNEKPVIDPGFKLRDGDRVTFMTPEMGG